VDALLGGSAEPPAGAALAGPRGGGSGGGAERGGARGAEHGAFSGGAARVGLHGHDAEAGYQPPRSVRTPPRSEDGAGASTSGACRTRRLARAGRVTASCLPLMCRFRPCFACTSFWGNLNELRQQNTYQKSVLPKNLNPAAACDPGTARPGRDAGAVEIPWWTYGARGMQLWFPSALAEPVSPGAAAGRRYATDPELEFDREVYPVGISLSEVSIIGARPPLPLSRLRA